MFQEAYNYDELKLDVIGGCFYSISKCVYVDYVYAI